MASTRPDYSFQDGVVRRVSKALSTDGAKVVLAAACGAGKTRISSRIIRGSLRKGLRVLVLAHGQNVLKTQFAESLSESGLRPFVYGPGVEFDSKADLVVSLPFSLAALSRKQLGSFDLVIVDEAHHFYPLDGGIVAQLLKAIKPAAILLLTATPSWFVRANRDYGGDYKILVVPMTELLEHRVTVDPEISLASSSHLDIAIEDFIRSGEPRRAIRPIIAKSSVKEIEALIDGDLLSPYSGKHLIATSSQLAAKLVARRLLRFGVPVVVSVSEEDAESEEVARFRYDPKVTTLIVCGRGVLGFDFPALETVVDLTFSINPDRLFQLLNRVSRNDGKGTKKTYIKVMPEAIFGLAEIALSCATALGVEPVVRSYVGNWRTLRVPMEEGPAESKKMVGFKKFRRIPPFLLMKAMLESGMDTTTFAEAKGEIIGRRVWTYNACVKEAMKYTTRGAFFSESESAYNAARRAGWLDSVCSHMREVQVTWSKKKCREEAKRFTTRTELFRGCPGAYYAIARNNWFDECAPHLPAQKKWTRETVLSTMKKYRTLGEFSSKVDGAYRAARRDGYWDEVRAYFGRKGA